MTPDGAAIDALIDCLLAEDLGDGDVTSNAVIGADKALSAALVARQPLVLAGIDIAAAIFRRLDPAAEFRALVADGAACEAGQELAFVSGNARALLAAERPALNLLQHLSGIATLTRRYVDEIAGSGAVLLDTRKTTPGLRLFDKYAARMGGAQNHRMGLFDAILIKDNHIAAAGGVAATVKAARAHSTLAVEVECDTLNQAGEALAAGADRLLLDNMPPETLAKAVALAKGRVPLEASGGITLETIRAVAETGVDYISVGAITQSAPAVDIGMDYR